MRLRGRQMMIVAVLSGWVAVATSGQELRTTTPEAVGMSSERLARLTAVMDSYTRDKQIAGTVTLVMRAGRIVYFEPSGFLDIDKGVRMPKDAIFRIASMSKAITTVGAMMLVEEGRMLLTDPVSQYIPSFANTTVRESGAGLAINAVRARRPVTIRDLMTHTSGVSYGAGALEELYTAAGFTEWYFADRQEPIGAWIDKLATLPFEANPGERYVYGYSTDILGRVIEKVSGQSLDRYLATRIFEPLEMSDTSFFLPAGKEPRLATVYGRLRRGTVTRASDGHPGQGAYVHGPRAAFSGGAGLLSTATDYARFLQMMLNGGELAGVRLLSPKTVELMTRNHIGDLYPSAGRGFGLGFETVNDLGRSGRYGSEGEFSWGSAYFSRYWVDPQEQLVAVFLAQLLPAGGLDLQEKVRVLVNQAIVGPVGRGEGAPAPTSRPR
jgi:CubicO group peptidase (beta-lactamase class C family)